MRKLTEIDCTNICDDYLIGLSYNLLSEKYNICTWSIGNVLKKNIYTFQVNSKSDIELIENILKDKDCEGCKKTRAAAIKYGIIGSFILGTSVYGIFTLFNKILEILAK